MTDRIRLPKTACLAAALIVSLAALSGCAAIGDSVISQAFVDPAKFDLYDCKQLDYEHSSLEAQIRKVEGLMRKADSGVAGPVVAEVAYRNEHINLKAQLRLLEQTQRERRCAEAPAPAR